MISRSTKARKQFYDQWVNLLEGGIPTTSSFTILSEKSSSAVLKTVSKKVKRHVERGKSVSAALKTFPKVFPSDELALIEAGETGSSLDAVLKQLSNKLAKEIEITQKIVAKMWQPIILLHLVIMLFPFMNYVQQKINHTQLVFSAFVPIGLLYLMAFVLWSLLKNNTEFKKSFIKLCLSIPFIGSLIQKIDYHRFFLVYWIFLKAGISIQKTLEETHKVAQTRKVRKGSLFGAKALSKGGQVIEGIKKSRTFPVALMERWDIGFAAGKEEQACEQILKELQADIDHKLDLLAFWIPKIIYSLMALLAAYKIVQFYSSHLQGLNEISDMF